MFGFFLLFVIFAIIIGIITHSWIWGVVSFIATIILIPRIILWLSGNRRKGSVIVDEKQVDLLDQLEEIGKIKKELPLNQRGWCNILGLYVQIREAAGMERLEAGDNKLHPQIDALRNSPFEPWEVKKYNSGGWEKLVNPTFDIANWLTTHGGLPEEYAESFNRAIQVFKKEGHFELPDVINDGGKPMKLKALESDEDNKINANNTISPEGLEEMSDVLLNRSYQKDAEYSQIQSDGVSNCLAYTDEIENRLIEFKKAASNCGLNIELAVNDVAEACEEANKVKTDTLEEKTGKWWPAFFKAYGGICVGRWQRQCTDLIDDAAKKKLWLDQFEPVWVTGCNYNKAIVIRNMRNADKKIDPKKMAKVKIRDKIKLDEYLDGVAKDVNEILSSEIIKFKSLQREILFKVIDNAPH